MEPMLMKVLVTGGRDFSDTILLFETLDEIHSKTTITQVIHGAASGADTLANTWALQKKVPVESCPADWARYGRAAGPVRNKEMLEAGPDLVVAFPGGKGTADMVKRARKAGLEVVVVQPSV